MARKICGDGCPDAPFPHIELITNGRINPVNGDPIPGQKFIVCLECRHYWNRDRGNCKCSEPCHLSDLIDIES